MDLLEKYLLDEVVLAKLIFQFKLLVSTNSVARCNNHSISKKTINEHFLNRTIIVAQFYYVIFKLNLYCFLDALCKNNSESSKKK